MKFMYTHIDYPYIFLLFFGDLQCDSTIMRRFSNPHFCGHFIAMQIFAVVSSFLKKNVQLFLKNKQLVRTFLFGSDSIQKINHRLTQLVYLIYIYHYFFRHLIGQYIFLSCSWHSRNRILARFCENSIRIFAINYVYIST